MAKHTCGFKDMAYAPDKRLAVLSYRDAGHSQQETCDKFGVSVAAIRKWERWRAAGRDMTKRTARTETRVYNNAELRAFMRLNPDASLNRIAKKFGGSVMGAHNALERNNIPYKHKQDPKTGAGIFNSGELRSYMRQNPAATLKQIADRFGGTIMGAHTALERNGIPYFHKRSEKTKARVYGVEKLCAYMLKNPDASLKEIADEFNSTVMGAYNALRRNKIPYKHRRTRQKAG